MKFRSFRTVPGAWVIPLFCLSGVLVFTFLIIYAIKDNQLTPFLLTVNVLYIAFGFGLAVYSSQQTMCSITLYDTHLICKIPFGKNIKIIYEKCYVGMDYHIQNGGKIWWIYLCYGKMPAYKAPHLGNRINSVKCQAGFVRIMYRDEVYTALLGVLPKKQSTALITARRFAGLEDNENVV